MRADPICQMKVVPSVLLTLEIFAAREDFFGRDRQGLGREAANRQARMEQRPDPGPTYSLQSTAYGLRGRSRSTPTLFPTRCWSSAHLWLRPPAALDY
jgi:hypothetical protein